jgi:hypothetical protein
MPTKYSSNERGYIYLLVGFHTEGARALRQQVLGSLELRRKGRRYHIGLQLDRILSKNIRIRIRILTDTDIQIWIFSDMDTDMIFFTDTDMDTVWNLDPNTDADTDNYPDPKVLKFRISVTLKYI